MLWVCKFVKKELVLDFYPFKQSFAFGGEMVEIALNTLLKT